MGKMLARPHVVLLLVVASLVVITRPGLIEAQLVNGFYASHGCPRAESIIRSAVTTAIQQNSANAPGLLRIFFHDCIVNVRVQKKMQFKFVHVDTEFELPQVIASFTRGRIILEHAFRM
jgi:hypothetical protein